MALANIFFALLICIPIFRKIGKLQRCSIFINQGFYIYIIILQITIFKIKIFLGKIKRLMYQVGVSIIHLMNY